MEGGWDLCLPEKSLDVIFPLQSGFPRDFSAEIDKKQANERNKSPISLLKNADFEEFLSFFREMWPKDCGKSQKSDLESEKNEIFEEQKNLTVSPPEAGAEPNREKEKKDEVTVIFPPRMGFTKELPKENPRTPSTNFENKKTITREFLQQKACAPTLARPDPGQNVAQKTYEKGHNLSQISDPWWARSPDSPPPSGVGCNSDAGRPYVEIAGAWKGPKRDEKNPMGTLNGDALPPLMREK